MFAGDESVLGGSGRRLFAVHPSPQLRESREHAPARDDGWLKLELGIAVFKDECDARRPDIRQRYRGKTDSEGRECDC